MEKCEELGWATCGGITCSSTDDTANCDLRQGHYFKKNSGEISYRMTCRAGLDSNASNKPSSHGFVYVSGGAPSEVENWSDYDDFHDAIFTVCDETIRGTLQDGYR